MEVLNSGRTAHQDENILLLSRLKFSRSVFLRKFLHTRWCITSKAALLILLWSFLFGLWNGVAFNPDLYMRNFVGYSATYIHAGYGFVAFIMLFFPLAGFLADVKFGRYKTVIASAFITLLAAIPFIAVNVPIVLILVGLIDTNGYESPEAFWTLVGIPDFMIIAFTYTGIIGFNANIVQFGMDQLHDSPVEDSTLFIHWYVWVYYFSTFICQVAWNITIQFPYNRFPSLAASIIGCCLLGLIPLSIFIILTVTLHLVKQRWQWFLIEEGRLNPYRLVYNVTKFSRQVKAPLNRSAFTYDEDEVPMGLDLGKEKYGGPFTTEQVENVKAFYGILKVLISFGGVFFLDYAASAVLPIYALHTTPFYEGNQFTHYNASQIELGLLNSSLLSPLLIAVCIPLYLCVLRPFISHRVPGMMKRMGIAVCLTVLSLTVSLFMDLAAHLESLESTPICMFQLYANHSQPLWDPVPQNSWFLVFPLALSALSHMLIYIAAFEFICAQSPHSMKGLLIGLFYAIKGLYQLLATIFALVPQYLGSPSTSISCGFYYYLANIVIGVIVILVYSWVTKRYRYSERDEPNNIHIYAEEYYSNPLQEQHYDYDCKVNS